MSLRSALLLWIRGAAEAYGGDLPVRCRLPAKAPSPDAQRPTAPPMRVAEAVVAVAPPVMPAPPIELPGDLEGLRSVAAACRRCKLCKTRSTVVFGEGNAAAQVMFIGEAPGAREDETGRPFVGPAGELLTRIIENAMGLRRSDVFIANVNKCRPPNNRDPEPDEVAACMPFLHAQIQAIAPRVLVTLGRVAAQNLLGTALPMNQLRSRDLEWRGIPVVATWHPAYLLRQPSAKRDTWEDIKRVNRLLGRPDDPRVGHAGA
ncbi:MAG: uracil-DNA glycosylase [Planctomycetota bacterium]